MTSRNWRYTADDLPSLSPFGSVLADRITVSEFQGSAWSEPKLIPLAEFSLHPGSHCLHYGSSCFEGLKAYRWEDGSVAVFRSDMHAERMYQSAQTLRLPPPDVALFQSMITDVVTDAVEMVPPAPGSLYLRPVLLGTDPNIGAASAASSSAIFYILASPVGNYFAAGEKALRLLVEDKLPRETNCCGR